MAYRVPIKKEELDLLREELKPLRALFQNLPNHLVITDANANIIYASPTTTEITGYSLDELIGRNPGDMWGGHMGDGFYEDMWKTIKTDKKKFIGAMTNVRKDGREYYIELYIMPVLDKRQVKYFIGYEPQLDPGTSYLELTDEQNRAAALLSLVYGRNNIELDELLAMSERL